MLNAFESVKHGVMVQPNNGNRSKARNVGHKLRQRADQSPSQLLIAAGLQIGDLDAQRQQGDGEGEYSVVETQLALCS